MKRLHTILTLVLSLCLALAAPLSALGEPSLGAEYSFHDIEVWEVFCKARGLYCHIHRYGNMGDFVKVECNDLSGKDDLISFTFASPKDGRIVRFTMRNLGYDLVHGFTEADFPLGPQDQIDLRTHLGGNSGVLKLGSMYYFYESGNLTAIRFNLSGYGYEITGDFSDYPDDDGSIYSDLLGGRWADGQELLLSMLLQAPQTQTNILFPGEEYDKIAEDYLLSDAFVTAEHLAPLGRLGALILPISDAPEALMHYTYLLFCDESDLLTKQDAALIVRVIESPATVIAPETLTTPHNPTDLRFLPDPLDAVLCFGNFRYCYRAGVLSRILYLTETHTFTLTASCGFELIDPAADSPIAALLNAGKADWLMKQVEANLVGPITVPPTLSFPDSFLESPLSNLIAHPLLIIGGILTVVLIALLCFTTRSRRSRYMQPAPQDAPAPIDETPPKPPAPEPGDDLSELYSTSRPEDWAPPSDRNESFDK